MPKYRIIRAMWYEIEIDAENEEEAVNEASFTDNDYWTKYEQTDQDWEVHEIDPDNK